MTPNQQNLFNNPPSPQLRDWLSERGYTAKNALDAVYIMRSVIKFHNPTGWRESFKQECDRIGVKYMEEGDAGE